MSGALFLPKTKGLRHLGRPRQAYHMSKNPRNPFSGEKDSVAGFLALTRATTSAAKDLILLTKTFSEHAPVGVEGRFIRGV